MLRFGIEHDDDLKLAGWSSEAVCKYLEMFGNEHDDDLKLGGWSSEAVCKYL